jgi:hypothetical protein
MLKIRSFKFKDTKYFFDNKVNYQLATCVRLNEKYGDEVTVVQ